MQANADHEARTGGRTDSTRGTHNNRPGSSGKKGTTAEKRNTAHRKNFSTPKRNLNKDAGGYGKKTGGSSTDRSNKRSKVTITMPSILLLISLCITEVNGQHNSTTDVLTPHQTEATLQQPDARILHPWLSAHHSEHMHVHLGLDTSSLDIYGWSYFGDHYIPHVRTASSQTALQCRNVIHRTHIIPYDTVWVAFWYIDTAAHQRSIAILLSLNNWY
jgi:hypothetical protein